MHRRYARRCRSTGVVDRITYERSLSEPRRPGWAVHSVDHERLLRIVFHRIADRRILRLIRGWLRAGVVEGKEWKETDMGTPQGAGISPLLANIFLHYILDLWVHQWRQRKCTRRRRGRAVLRRLRGGLSARG